MHSFHFDSSGFMFFFAGRRFVKVLSSIYKVAHPVLEPEDNSRTVVLLEDLASEA